MFYKHWKKLALALTGFFWASCESNTAAAVDTEDPASSDSNASSSSINEGVAPSSSSEATPPSSSSEAAPPSSSSETAPVSSGTDFERVVPLYGINMSATVFRSSSSKAESSSSFEQIMPAYGVYDRVACYDDEKGVKTNGETSITKLYCDDGVTCKETEVIKDTRSLPCSTIDEGDLKGAVVCPDYGIVVVTEKTYDCDGVIYNEAEFLSHYYRKYSSKPKSSSSATLNTSSSVAQSSSSAKHSSSSAAPIKNKIPCYKHGSEQIECDDGSSYSISTDNFGNTVYENEYGIFTEKEFLKNHNVLDEMIALYGPPCMFNGTCDDDK